MKVTDYMVIIMVAVLSVDRFQWQIETGSSKVFGEDLYV